MERFELIAEMRLSNKDRLDRSFARNLKISGIYVWVIDGLVVYVGQTKNLYKRLDTYCNAKYWNNSNYCNVYKSYRLENAVRKHQRVQLYLLRCPISDLDVTEIKYINELNPTWNKKYSRGNHEKS